jgi:hypothetical protein
MSALFLLTVFNFTFDPSKRRHRTVSFIYLTDVPSSRNVSIAGKFSCRLTVAAIPCPRLLCRGEISDNDCKFKHMKKEHRFEGSEEV